jgi:hypothetical protein
MTGTLKVQNFEILSMQICFLTPNYFIRKPDRIFFRQNLHNKI